MEYHKSLTKSQIASLELLLLMWMGWQGKFVILDVSLFAELVEKNVMKNCFKRPFWLCSYEHGKHMCTYVSRYSRMWYGFMNCFLRMPWSPVPSQRRWSRRSNNSKYNTGITYFSSETVYNPKEHLMKPRMKSISMNAFLFHKLFFSKRLALTLL